MVEATALDKAEPQTHRAKPRGGLKKRMTLKAYMVLLATDVEHLAAFVADPARACEKAGLSVEDRSVLFSGNQSLIYGKLTDDDRTTEDRN